jgi:GNAT superfamily N-acetyltransferase/RimJ/RimL family protein N-acetyltransferase
VQITPLDPRDERAFADWFAVLEAAERHDRPDEPGHLLHEQRAIALDGIAPDPDTACLLLAARTGTHVVGAARLELPQRDNRHLCEVVLAVHPDARRRGAGRALTERVEVLAREHGRTTVLGLADEPPGSEGRSPGRCAALALGYDVVQTEVRRDIDLPLDPARVAELERGCAAASADYTMRTWRDRCPDDLVDDLADLMRQMSTDVPKDEMDWREEVWDAARVRRDEARTAAGDRTSVGAGAVHRPTGRMVAFTRSGLPRSQPERAYQWETLVSAAHRGRRLGTRVKLAALQDLARCSPRTRSISTWNAQENAHMIAVNDALGARTNGLLAIVQKVLASG